MECVEVLDVVFMRLSSRDLAMACCCSRLWREVGCSEQLWRELCIKAWPCCHTPHAKGVIQPMGGFRVFFMRRALSICRPPNHHRPKQLSRLHLHHLTFFVDLTYTAIPILSHAISGNSIPSSLCFSLPIQPFFRTDPLLPRQALTPLLHRGHLFYDKPFNPVYAASYSLTWTVVRSTDHKVACLLHNAPCPHGVLQWEIDGEEGGDEFCLPLLFEAELKKDETNALWCGLLKQPPFMAFACLDCRPVWGDSLDDPMHFKLMELQLGIWRKDDKCPPSLDKMLLAFKELDWK